MQPKPTITQSYHYHIQHRRIKDERRAVSAADHRTRR